MATPSRSTQTIPVTDKASRGWRLAIVCTGLATFSIPTGIGLIGRTGGTPGIPRPDPDPAAVTWYADIATWPAPPHAPARITANQALAPAGHTGMAGLASGEPVVALRLAARDTPADGQRHFSERLVWIVEFPHSQPMLFGPPGLPPQFRQAREESSDCSAVFIVEATTGGNLAGALQVCRRNTLNTGASVAGDRRPAAHASLEFAAEDAPMSAAEVTMVSDLAETVRLLADYHSKSPALVVETPDGEYVISPDGMGGGLQNRFVISRSQLAALMWENGYRRGGSCRAGDCRQARRAGGRVSSAASPGMVSLHGGVGLGDGVRRRGETSSPRHRHPQKGISIAFVAWRA